MKEGRQAGAARANSYGSVTDNLRVLESAQEISLRPVINSVEAQEERVFAMRKDPLRFEMFCRNSKDGMRLDCTPPPQLCPHSRR